MAMMAITTRSSIKVKWACAGDKENFFSREKKFYLSPAPPFSFKKSEVFCRSRWSQSLKKHRDETVVFTNSSISVKKNVFLRHPGWKESIRREKRVQLCIAFNPFMLRALCTTVRNLALLFKHHSCATAPDLHGIHSFIREDYLHII